MTHLTLQEVIEKIHTTYPSLRKDERTQNARIEDQAHRPEFYVPRIVLRWANFRFSGSTK